MINFYVYFHINPLTKEVFYVGKGNGRRAYRKNRNTLWKNIVNKYGDPIVLIVKRNITERYAFELEKAYIKLFGRRDLNEGSLVNLTDGGEGSSGNILSNEQKRKISNSLKGRISNRKGVTLTQEQKDKLSDSNWRKKNVGKDVLKLSEQTKSNISKSIKEKFDKGEMSTNGDNNGMWGKGNKILVNGVIYNNMRECAEAEDCHIKTVQYRLNSENFPNYIRL